MYAFSSTLAHSIFQPFISEEKVEPISPPDALIFSALGARVCYGVFPLDALKEDERLISKEKMVEFLLRLAKAKHTSIFAHSPVFINEKGNGTHAINPSLCTAGLYKAWFLPAHGSCLNVRHFVDFVINKDHQMLEKVFKIWANSQSKYKIFYWNKKKEEWKRLPAGKKKTSDIDLVIFFIKRKPWHWYFVVARNISVIATHQLVRHTWLNISQESHRYCKVDNFVIPPSIKEIPAKHPVAKHVKKTIKNGLSLYNQLITSFNVKKEDARFILPSGRATMIAFSGPQFVIEDFVRKRLHPHAQWEIRNLAEKIAEFPELKKVLKSNKNTGSK
jgi:thymidylate synthase (FAD)